MKTNEFPKTFLVVLTMILAFVMSAEVQPKQAMEFQATMDKYAAAYKNLIKEGKYKEAISPLTTLINLLDTTNIHKVVNITEASVRQLNAPYCYDLACCYAVTGQKKQALKALERAVNLG